MISKIFLKTKWEGEEKIGLVEAKLTMNWKLVKGT